MDQQIIQNCEKEIEQYKLDSKNLNDSIKQLLKQRNDRAKEIKLPFRKDIEFPSLNLNCGSISDCYIEYRNKWKSFFNNRQQLIIDLAKEITQMNLETLGIVDIGNIISKNGLIIPKDKGFKSLSITRLHNSHL